jgi:Secretion system C-terminal sorting domain
LILEYLLFEWPNQIVAFGDQSLYLSATAHNWRWPYMCPNEVDPWCQNGQALFNSTTATKWVLSRFNISAPIVTSAEELTPSQEDQARVFPNPTNDVLNVIMPVLKNHFNVRIYNSLGELVLEKKFLNTSQFTIDVLNLSSGFYSLQIKTEDTEFNYNFVKND